MEADLKDPTVWVGELYFENHRGTYTSQAAVKLGNRRCEEKLHDLEFLASLANLIYGQSYPGEIDSKPLANGPDQSIS